MLANLTEIGQPSNSVQTHISGIKLFCCVVNIQFGNVTDGYQGYTPITGVEYEGGITPQVFSLENNGGQSLTDLSPPCAVCHLSTRSARMMFPAMTTCPTGWNFEYGGYLVSSRWDQYRSSFICLDSAPETIVGSGGSTNGTLIYPVEVACVVSLPCPPYVNGYEVACVVCTM